MAEPVVFDLDVNNEKALLAFDESIRGMQQTKAASEQLIAAMGGIEKVAEAAGVSTAQAAKLVEQSVKQSAKAVEKAQQDAGKATEKASNDAAAAAIKAAKDAEKAQIKSAKEAEKALERFEKLAAKAYREQQLAAEKAARSAGNSWNQIAKRMQSNQVISDIEQLGGMLGLVGGSVSKFGMLLSSTVRPVSMLSEALTAAFGPQAPVILGLLALPVAGAAAIAILKGLANAGLEASERLEKLGLKIAPDSKRAFDEYEGSTQRLSVAMDRLKVAVGDDLADVLADAVELTAAFAEKMEALETVLHYTARGGLFVVTLGMSELVLGLAAAGALVMDLAADWQRSSRQQAEAIATVTTAQSQAAGLRAKLANDEKKLQAEIEKDRRKAFDEQLERDKRREKELQQEAEKRQREAEQRIKQEQETQDKLSAIVASGMDELMSEEGKLYAERNKRIEQVRDLEISEEQAANAILMINEQLEAQLQQLYQKRWDDAKEKRDEAYKDEKAAAEKFGRDISRMLADRARDDAQAQKEALQGALTEMADAWLTFVQDIAQLRIDALEEDLDRLKNQTKNAREQLRDQWEDFRDATRGMSQEDRARFRQQTKDERDASRAAIEELRARQDAQRKAIRETFAVSQAAATAQVIMQGALAYMGMLAGLAASLGPAAPAAPFIAAGIVGPAVAAQLAQIASQKPPAHSGKVFGADEFFVGDQMVRQGERGAILNQRTVETGGVDKVNAMNEGRDKSTSTAPMQVVFADGGRVVGEAWMREVKRPGSPLARAVGSAPRGFSDPYRRGGK